MSISVIKQAFFSKMQEKKIGILNSVHCNDSQKWKMLQYLENKLKNNEIFLTSPTY